MEDASYQRLKKVWNQQDIPVILRRGKGHRTRLRLPFAKENRSWIQGGRKRDPKWFHAKHYWEIPQAWFNDLVSRLLSRFGKVYVIQPYREQEKCAPACWNAKGHECQCSCMGEHHGTGDPGGRWFIASEAFATRWHEQDLACRLLTKNE